jgi:hypothetical protein
MEFRYKDKRYYAIVDITELSNHKIAFNTGTDIVTITNNNVVKVTDISDYVVLDCDDITKYDAANFMRLIVHVLKGLGNSTLADITI